MTSPCEVHIFCDNANRSRTIASKILQNSKMLEKKYNFYNPNSLAKQGLVQAEVALSKSLNLPLGASLNIAVLTKEQRGCIVPSGTILHKKEGNFVMEYRDGKFVPMAVNSLMSEGDTILISPCPTLPIALESEVKFAVLPIYGEVEVRE